MRRRFLEPLHGMAAIFVSSAHSDLSLQDVSHLAIVNRGNHILHTRYDNLITEFRSKIDSGSRIRRGAIVSPVLAVRMSTTIKATRSECTRKLPIRLDMVQTHRIPFHDPASPAASSRSLKAEIVEGKRLICPRR